MKVGFADSYMILPYEWTNRKFRNSWFLHFAELGAREVRYPWYADWGPEQSAYQSRLFAAISEARSFGVTVSVVLMGKPGMIGTTHTVDDFAVQAARFATQCGNAVSRFVLWNEPNSRNFWAPRSTNITPEDRIVVFHSLLARTYDEIRKTRPKVAISGMGLAASHEPFQFVRTLAAAHRASSRQRELYTELSYHPYPGSSRDGFAGSVRRLRDLFHTHAAEFSGTSQPGAVPINADEFGWQCDTGTRPGYTEAENVPVTTESRQAVQYAAMIEVLADLGYVRSALIYKLADEDRRKDWQSGVLRADLSQRPSYEAVKEAIHNL